MCVCVCTCVCSCFMHVVLYVFVTCTYCVSLCVCWSSFVYVYVLDVCLCAYRPICLCQALIVHPMGAILPPSCTPCGPLISRSIYFQQSIWRGRFNFNFSPQMGFELSSFLSGTTGSNHGLITSPHRHVKQYPEHFHETINFNFGLSLWRELWTSQFQSQSI